MLWKFVQKVRKSPWGSKLCLKSLTDVWGMCNNMCSIPNLWAIAERQKLAWIAGGSHKLSGHIGLSRRTCVRAKVAWIGGKLARADGE